MAIYTNNNIKWQQRAIMLALGIGQGFIIWLISHYLSAYKIKPESMALQAFVLVGVFFVQYLWNAKRIMMMLLLAFGFAALFSYPIYYTYSQLSVDVAVQRGWMVGFGAGMGSYITLVALTIISAPFLKIYHRSNRFKFPHRELMNSAWSMIIILFYTLLLVTVAWAMLWFINMLLESLEVKVFKEIISSTAWVYIFTLGCFGFFWSIIRDSSRAIVFLYKAVAALSVPLLPIISFVQILFFVTLIFSGLYNLLDIQFSATFSLLLLIALEILLYNGAYKDCYNNCPYPSWIKLIVKFAIVLLPVYSILAIHAINLRIDQYGLTVTRIWALIFAFTGLYYSVGYATSIILYNRRWMYLVAPTNKIGAFLVVITLILVNTPLIDPYLMSAKNQYKRFSNKEVSPSSFDYGYLEFELGEIGKSYLDRIHRASHPKSDYIRRTIGQLRSNTFYDWQRYKQQKELVREVGLGHLVADEINYPFLHFNMKKAGKELFDRLLKMEYHPQYYIIKASIEELKPYKTWEEWSNRIPSNRADYNPKNYKIWEFEWELEE